jgi:polyhydroxyalkanoate synthesis regulator phasin
MAERSGNKGAGGRGAAERSPRKPATEGGDEVRADKSVQAFREALEKSVMLSRDRLQEVVDDAVSRGRITRDDANELVSRLVARGRQQTDSLLRDLERLLGQARDRLR